jgi:hypothetical protein
MIKRPGYLHLRSEIDIRDPSLKVLPESSTHFGAAFLWRHCSLKSLLPATMYRPSARHTRNTELGGILV